MINYGITHNVFICDICGREFTILKKCKEDRRPPRRWTVSESVKCEMCIFYEDLGGM